MLLMLRFNVIICMMNELDITNEFHTYFPIQVPIIPEGKGYCLAC